MRTRGDGLEPFLEPIRPEEGQTRDVMRALFLLRGLLRKKKHAELGTKLFKTAVDLAVATLREILGLNRYEGFLDTYFYCRPNGSVRQICSGYGRSKLDHLRALAGQEYEDLSDRESGYPAMPAS